MSTYSDDNTNHLSLEDNNLDIFFLDESNLLYEVKREQKTNENEANSFMPSLGPAPINQKIEEDLIDNLFINENNYACPEVVVDFFSEIPTPNGYTPFSVDDLIDNDYTDNDIPFHLANQTLDIIPTTDNINKPTIPINNTQPLPPNTLTEEEEVSLSDTVSDSVSILPPVLAKKKYQNNSRKYKPDSIRKKIKSRALKNLRRIFNQKIKMHGGKSYFDYFPQIFVSSVIVKKNKEALNLSMRELFQKDFGGREKDRIKMANNIKVLLYLENNPEISKKSGIDLLLKCPLKIILYEYFSSSHFKQDIMKLHEEGEDEEYLIKYQYIANNWIPFYENNGRIPDNHYNS